MSSEYLRKTVADRRTGANLIGINVDTSNMTGIDTTYLQAVEQLEKFAKQSDELKIQNEKNKIALESEKKRIEFQQKYLEDPSIYTDQSKWENVCKLWEEEKKNQKKRVAESIYLNKDEKTIYSKQIDNNFAQAWTAPMVKRNEAELRMRVDEATQLLETAIFNASQSGLYRIDTIDNFMKTGDKILSPLVTLGGMTEQDKISTLIDGISKIDIAIFNRNFESQIIYNNGLTYEEKKAKISEIKSMMSDKRINEIADSFAKHYKINDGQKEYLKYKLKQQYQKSEIILDKQLYKWKTQKTTEDKIEKLYKSEQKKENALIQAIEDKDNFKVAKLKEGYDLTTSEMVSSEYSYILQENYGVDMSVFGNEKNPLCGRVVNQKGIDEIKFLIEDLTKDKTEKINTKAIVENVIYPYVQKNSNSKYQQIAILKDLGNRIKGMNTTVLLKGQEKPIYFDVWDTLSGADASAVKFANNGAFIGSGKGKLNFDRLWKELGGTTKARNALAQYLVGVVENSQDPYIMGYIKDKRYNEAIEKYLKKDENFYNIDKDILQALKDIKISPINYKEATLKPYKRKIRPFPEDKVIKEEKIEVKNDSRKSI